MPGFRSPEMFVGSLKIILEEGKCSIGALGFDEHSLCHAMNSISESTDYSLIVKGL